MVSQRVTRFPEGFQCNAQLQEQFARHRLHFITCPLLVCLSLSLSPFLFSSPSPFLLSPALSRHRISLSLSASLSLCFSSLLSSSYLLLLSAPFLSLSPPSLSLLLASLLSLSPSPSAIPLLTGGARRLCIFGVLLRNLSGVLS